MKYQIKKEFPEYIKRIKTACNLDKAGELKAFVEGILVGMYAYIEDGMSYEEYSNYKKELEDTNPIFTIDKLPKKSSQVLHSFILEYDGLLLRCRIYDRANKRDEITVWDETGGRHIYTAWANEVDLNKLKERIEGHKQGKRPCAECGKLITDKEVELDWFASVFCADCVTDEMRRERNWDYSHLD